MWLAEAHGLAAAAPCAAAAGAPPEVACALVDLAARTAARAQRLQSDLATVRGSFRESGVRHAPLKAAWLWEKGLAGPDRPAADLDFFVPATDMARAEAALRSLGYARVLLTRRHVVFVRDGNMEVVDSRGEHPDNPRPVELHPRLAESHRGIVLDLTHEVADVAIRSAVAVVHLAAHASVDALNGKLRAIALLDVDRVAGSLGDSDWDDVMRLSANGHAARFVWPSLHLAVAETQASVPHSVMRELAANVRPALVSLVHDLDVDLASRAGAGDRRRTLAETLQIWPRTPGEHLTVWRHIVFPGTDVLAERWSDSGEVSRGALVARHVRYSSRVLVRRWRQRAA